MTTGTLSMNKKKIVLFLILLTVVIGGVFGVREFLSYRKVSIVFKQPELTVDIYSEDKKKITSVSDNAVIKLKEGTYYYTTANERYTSKQTFFKISGNEVIEINPAYSNVVLEDMLYGSRDIIQATYLVAYPSIAEGYIIGDEHLANHGEWYSAKIIQRVSGGNEPDVYRIILKKDSNTWKIAASPRLAISIQDFPKIPDYVIRQVNSPLSSAAYDLLYPM